MGNSTSRKSMPNICRESFSDYSEQLSKAFRSAKEVDMKESLSFDDVLLTPQYSDISSRKEVDISSSLGIIKRSKVEPSGVHFTASISEKEERLFLPIISSPMDTVTEDVMANAMAHKI